ncbi:MAG: hypothetical protein SFX73_28785 [Kofleriaceae bacterium]|nr:hypothetical protein [Kofleriaceae bacterium]
MRNLLIATGISLLTTAAACNDSPDPLKDPPVLKVTSPKRSTIQNGAGLVQVTGNVIPNELSAEPIEKVLVNGVQATLNADGSFTAMIDIKEGATLIHVEARDAAGKVAKDTRAIQAGELRPVGTNVENAITAAMSKQAFAKLSAAAGPMIESMDMAAMLAPMQPMVHAGDENGEDCLYGRVWVDDVNMTNADISIVPSNAGLQFRAQIDGLDVPARAKYAAACIGGENTIGIKAERVVVSGTLVVTPSGTAGFKTTLADETVQITGLDIQASGLPGDVIDLLRLDSIAGYIISKAAPMAMEPMMNDALGGLAGPQQMNVMGKTLAMEVDPTSIDINSAGALITLDTKAMISGAEGSPGFIFTDNGVPGISMEQGIQIGLADDLANQMLAQITSLNMLNLAMESHGGTFDGTSISMTLAPMISADPLDGKMKVILGDMMATYTDHGTPVGRAAINAAIELKVVPATNGKGVALQLGEPTAHVTVLDDIANTTRMDDKDLSAATEIVLKSQIESIGKLLGNIPIPAVAGVQLRNVSVGSDDGYVIVSGEIQ